MKARIRESGGYLPSVGEYVSGDDGELYRVTSISRDIHTASPGEANYVYGEVEAFWGDATDLEWHQEPVCGCTVLEEEEPGEGPQYEAYHYAADGVSDGDVIATGSLDECRRAIAERIAGDLDSMRWQGMDDDVEAFHESGEDGCGGYAIRIAQTGRYAIVRSEEVYTYASTAGSLGTAIGKQPTLRQAQELAREIADDYHYGVEIVDETTWTVVQ